MRLPRALCAAVLVVVALGGCATTTDAGDNRPALPRTERERDDLIKAAQQFLVERCLAERGLSPEGALGRGADEGTGDRARRLQGALFGRGRPELAVTLPTGYTVKAHTDGCLAAAHRELYGDERRWFRTQVVVNNLRTEARRLLKDDPDYRMAHARWVRCAAPAEGPRPDRPDPGAAARCARESGLDEVRARLEPGLMARVRTDRHDQLTTYRQLRTRALHRAADLYAARTVAENRQKGSTPS
ncbi:hypothetical protein O1Q96_30295 [Streptomyces sp. Qhu-G9]|uniref:hypothetical protein n=1 Tax=Streptomyces sp. Qhu-G9 TaxID=3452799 RepID=UPI0022AC5868|nr:hypothetical protein [Streptomyces aurantiacus]WAU83605.1 hypothetical protein O1Q96_30295 [Streptomyces aurantiacus]